MPGIADLLVGFMPLTGNQYDVIWIGLPYGIQNSRRAAQLDHRCYPCMISLCLNLIMSTVQDGLCDGLRVFAAWIIIGNNNRISVPLGDCTHLGALGLITITATTHDATQRPIAYSCYFAQGCQCALKCI